MPQLISENHDNDQMMNNPEQQLIDIISTEPEQEVPAGITALSDAARDRHGNSVRAVLFYGSSLRTGNVHEGLADLYLLVDNYSSAFKGFSLLFSIESCRPTSFIWKFRFKVMSCGLSMQYSPWLIFAVGQSPGFIPIFGAGFRNSVDWSTLTINFLPSRSGKPRLMLL